MPLYGLPAQLRGEINAVLRKGKAFKPNLNKEERIALNQLRKDKDRIILIVDKGVVMVVLDREDYNNEAKDLLNTPAYKEIPKDPTNKIKAQLITKLRRIKKDRKLDEGMYKTRYPTGFVFCLSSMGYPKSIKQALHSGLLSLAGTQ